ncbi:hypothetical protein TrRE_jg10963 [Triparma retinervis]|uniref:Uncharacterized protein n=1 Tax=Triparma retinervis TaxID=2557542 RepID=A0A9W7L7L0_9STRA|nr:hypothetical protein TrRE_jg10963 [Triparma retinervis]
MEDGQVHRKLKGKGKGKGDGAQSCLDISGKWLVLNPLTTYLNDDSTSNVYTVFEFNKAKPDTPCNYFGQEYFQQVQDPQREFEQSDSVALTTFPGYMGAREGDNQFLSLDGAGDGFAPGSAEFCQSGKSAKIYREAVCYDGTSCSSKNVMFMVKFPNPNTEIVGKTHSQLADELLLQTGSDLDLDC